MEGGSGSQSVSVAGEPTRFLDEQVALWGMPLFLGTLALEIEGP